jgi:hypothetical protein
VKPPITRLVPTKEVEAILSAPGGPLYGSPWRLPLGVAVLPGLPVAYVRATAAEIAASKGQVIAASSAYNRWVEYQPTVDALNALADRVEADPVEDFDLIHPTDAHYETVRYWVGLAKVRSALLERFADDLDDKFCDNGWVVGARNALAVLADVDLLLPGIDAELRPILTVYAGLDEPGSVTR